MNNNAKLKPCPHCGNNPVERFDCGMGWGYTIKCDNCGAQVRKWSPYPAKAINMAIEAWNMRYEETTTNEINGQTSDGCHTFDELYHHRAVLFSIIVHNYPELSWKSKLHCTGDMLDGMFIVGIDTPYGQATYHYDLDPYWDMFDCKELEFAPEWDGHTADQAIERIGKLRMKEVKNEQPQT